MSGPDIDILFEGFKILSFSQVASNINRYRYLYLFSDDMPAEIVIDVIKFYAFSRLVEFSIH